MKQTLGPTADCVCADNLVEVAKQANNRVLLNELRRQLQPDEVAIAIGYLTNLIKSRNKPVMKLSDCDGPHPRPCNICAGCAIRKFYERDETTPDRKN